MATTMKLIGKQTLSGTASSVSFSDIPGTYSDLLITMSVRTDRASNTWADLRIRFNGASTDTSHSSRYLQGNGASASSGSLAYCYLGSAAGSTATSNTFSSIEAYIPNYAGSTNKSYSVSSAHETNATTAYVEVTAGLWSSTAAITQVTFVPVGSFVSGCSFQLFGITKS